MILGDSLDGAYSDIELLDKVPRVDPRLAQAHQGMHALAAAPLVILANERRGSLAFCQRALFSVPVAMPPVPVAMAVTPIIVSIPVYISAYAPSAIPPAAPIVYGLDPACLLIRRATHHRKGTGACRTYDAEDDGTDNA